MAAVALVMLKPVGGAVELWLGCRSLGMPLWEASWWPKAALNCGSCSLGWVWVCVRRSREEGEDDGEVRPVWGRAERAALGCRIVEWDVDGGVDREVDRR